jgi:hypothetical protein
MGLGGGMFISNENQANGRINCKTIEINTKGLLKSYKG